MVYDGHVENGMVVVDGPVGLPDGTKVKVEVVTMAGQHVSDASEPTLYDQLAPLIGAAKGLPSDLARNHDHYLHGQPKK